MYLLYKMIFFCRHKQKKIYSLEIKQIVMIPLLISLIAIAAISPNVKCKKWAEIEFVNDYIRSDISKTALLITFVCWNYEEKYEFLNRISYNNYLASIYDMDSKKVQPFFPAQNVLYLVDLDCENSTNILVEAEHKKLFAFPYKWLLLTKNETFLNQYNEHFLSYSFLPDSNVAIAFKNDEKIFHIYEIYKYGRNTDYMVKREIFKWQFGVGFDHMKHRVLTENRLDLNGTVLKTPVVVLNNESLNHLTDYRFKHIDTISKVNFIFVNHLIDIVNGSKDFFFLNTWGYLDKSGVSYTGMIGYLQRDEAEIGGTPLFMTVERIPVIEYIAMTTPTRAKFIFRQPPLSYVANVFTLPFSRDVWISSIALVLLAASFLYVAVAWEWNQPDLEKKGNALQKSFLDSVMLTIGAVAQQGAVNEPRGGAGRIVMIFTFVALMFLYVSYSANIVALLQSSSTNIRTLRDLLESRLTLGVDDIVYNHYYFERATEKVRKAIYEKKVAPKGKKSNFMTMAEGVKRIQNGFFAFHCELGSGYKLISDTFLESEKCGLQEIEYLEMVEPYLSIKKNSSYKELFKIGLRKLLESGVQSRELQKLYTRKPECLTSGGNFISVGLLDAYAAFLVLGLGMAIAFILFLIEIFFFRRIRKMKSKKKNHFQ